MLRKRSSRLALLVVALVTASLVVVSLGSAKPAPAATVVLACDRNVTAFVTLQLLTELGGTEVGSTSISCGPDSVTGNTREREHVLVSGNYTWVNVTSFTIDSVGGCFGQGSTPYKQFCDPVSSGRGATLTVR